MDAQRVNLDGFAVEDPGLGLVALRSPGDPEPGLVIARRAGRRAGRDPGGGFDSIDAYIARHGLDLAVAEEAMGLPDAEFARRLVSPDVPRAEILRLSAGATPAKLARVLALLRPAELGMAMTKLRGRRTPSNQAHVTNRLDDPLLLAADSATAAAFGFREIETTVPVLGRRAEQRGGLPDRGGRGVPGRAHPVLGRGGAGAGAGHARADLLRGDRVAVRHRAGVHRRRRHAVVQGLPDLRVRVPRDEDAGLLRCRAPRC